jgi:hypothetical protein
MRDSRRGTTRPAGARLRSGMEEVLTGNMGHGVQSTIHLR